MPCVVLQHSPHAQRLLQRHRSLELHTRVGSDGIGEIRCQKFSLATVIKMRSSQRVLSSLCGRHLICQTKKFSAHQSPALNWHSEARYQSSYTIKYQNRIAIQRDFEDLQGLRDIVHIVSFVSGNKLILYGFIGNTISNIENPRDILNKIFGIMKINDLLLFEAQVVNGDHFTKMNYIKLLEKSIKVRRLQSLLQAHETIRKLTYYYG